MTTLNIDLRGATQEALAEITRQHGVILLALEFADSAARADIECNCRGGGCVDRFFTWDTAKPDKDSKDLVLRALRYLELRGDDLPYKVMREGDLIWFEDKP